MNGFVFNLSGGETVEESKKLMQVVRPFCNNLLGLVKMFYETSENDIVLDASGQVIWRDSRVGYLEKGSDIFAPKVKLIKSDELEKNEIEKVQRKLDIFIANKKKPSCQIY